MMEEDSTSPSGKQIQQTRSLHQSGGLNKSLLPSKAFYLFFFSALGSIFPYLSLFFKQLKLSSKQTGLLVGLRPFVQCIAVPIWGLVADKTNIRKLSLLVGTIGWLLTYTSIIFVHTATGETHPSCPINSSERTNMSTDINGTWSKDLSLNLSHRQPGVSLLNKNQTSASHGKVKDSLREPSFPNRSLNIDTYAYPSSNDTTVSDKDDIDTTSGTNLFLIFFIIIALGNVVSAPAQTMANIATLQALSKETYRYGQQRLFGSIGWGITAFVVGAAVGLSGTKASQCGEHDRIDYRPCFYVFGAMMSFACVVSIFMKLSKDDGGHDVNLVSNVRKQIDFTTVYLLATAVYCGFALGLIETFLFWHLHDLGGTQFLFSLITGVNSVAEMIGFFFSQYFLERFGHLNVIAVGLLSSTAQMLCYGLARNPWIVLSVEVLKSLAVSCTWSALLSHIGLRAGSVATLQTILHALYWGFGYASGGVIGGFFVHIYGAANVFLAMALVSGLDAFFLIIIIRYKGVGCGRQDYQELEETSETEFEAGTDIE